MSAKKIVVGTLLVGIIVVGFLWYKGYIFSSKSTPGPSPALPSSSPKPTPTPKPSPSSSPPTPVPTPVVPPPYHPVSPSPAVVCDINKQPHCPVGFDLHCKPGTTQYQCISSAVPSPGSSRCTIDCLPGDSLCYGTTCQDHEHPYCDNGVIKCADSCGVLSPGFVPSPGVEKTPGCIYTQSDPLKCFTCADASERPVCVGNTLECQSVCLGVRPACGEGMSNYCDPATKEWTKCMATVTPRQKLIRDNGWLNSGDAENNISVIDLEGKSLDIVFTTTVGGAIGEPIAPLASPDKTWFTGTLTADELATIANPHGQLVQAVDTTGKPRPGKYVLYRVSDTHDINGKPLVWYARLIPPADLKLPNMMVSFTDPCKNGGTYQSKTVADATGQYYVEVGSCQCPPNTAGDTCQFSNSADNPMGCGGKGQVHVDSNGVPYCTGCQPPYVGYYCEFDNVQECGQHGNLVASNYTWNSSHTKYIPTTKYCNCIAPYKGSQYECQFSDATTCSGHGSVSNDGKCTCYTGYYGTGCRYNKLPDGKYVLGINADSWVSVKLTAQTVTNSKTDPVSGNVIPVTTTLYKYPDSPPITLENWGDMKNTHRPPPQVAIFIINQGQLSFDLGRNYPTPLVLDSKGQIVQGSSSDKWYIRSDSSVSPTGFQLCHEDADGNIFAFKNDLSGFVKLNQSPSPDFTPTYFALVSTFEGDCGESDVCATGIYQIQNNDGQCLAVNTDPKCVVCGEGDIGVQDCSVGCATSEPRIFWGDCSDPLSLFYYDSTGKVLSTAFQSPPYCVTKSYPGNPYPGKLDANVCASSGNGVPTEVNLHKHGISAIVDDTTIPQCITSTWDNRTGTYITDVSAQSTDQMRVVPVPKTYNCSICHENCRDTEAICKDSCKTAGLGGCATDVPFDYMGWNTNFNTDPSPDNDFYSISGLNVTKTTMDGTLQDCENACTADSSCQAASYYTMRSGSDGTSYNICNLQTFKLEPGTTMRIRNKSQGWKTFQDTTLPTYDYSKYPSAPKGNNIADCTNNIYGGDNVSIYKGGNCYNLKSTPVSKPTGQKGQQDNITSVTTVFPNRS